MTNPTEHDPDTEARPPRYYPHPDWPDEGDPFFVPPEWRPYYAVAEPAPIYKEAYLKYGAEGVVRVRTEVPRVVSPGREGVEPVVTYEDQTVNQLRHFEGPEHYPAWLHSERLTIAERKYKEAERRKLA